MKAELVIRRRIAYGTNDFADMVIWRVPEPVPPSEHQFKYRLAYVVDGKCVMRLDNERGKGNHLHVGGVESPYNFVSKERLMGDFTTAVKQWRKDHGRA